VPKSEEYIGEEKAAALGEDTSKAAGEGPAALAIRQPDASQEKLWRWAW
jgi:hypothetical protein